METKGKKGRLFHYEFNLNFTNVQIMPLTYVMKGFYGSFFKLNKKFIKNYKNNVWWRIMG